MEEFFEHFGVRGLAWTRDEQTSPLFLESATLQLGKASVGRLGQAAPAIAKQYDLRDAALLAELSLDLLLARRAPAKSFKTLPLFPTVRRDVAMVVADTATHDAVLAVVKQIKPPHLERVELFDVFRGKNIPAGQKSVAYAFTYRSADRTLTEAEVNAATTKSSRSQAASRRRDPRRLLAICRVNHRNLKLDCPLGRDINTGQRIVAVPFCKLI